MAAAYVNTLPTAKDRVRRLIGDVAAPWTFQDEEIVALLALQPETDPAAIAEYRVAISLANQYYTSTSSGVTIRQGSVSRATTKRTVEDIDRLIASLQAMLNALLGLDSGIQSGIAVAECYFPDLDPANGYR
jgi:hypothetical protein